MLLTLLVCWGSLLKFEFLISLLLLSTRIFLVLLSASLLTCMNSSSIAFIIFAQAHEIVNFSFLFRDQAPFCKGSGCHTKYFVPRNLNFHAQGARLGQFYEMVWTMEAKYGGLKVEYVGSLVKLFL
ncbi:hypothetical protein OIU78_017024 [Salix suchowensis]|nr:hypothetical protein OIU78_017024 [Salix suchowensis]